MQKTLIILIVGLLSVGCLTPEQKQRRLRDSIIGEWEFKYRGGVEKRAFLENGILKQYNNDKKVVERKWSIVNGEIHVIYDSEYIRVYRINQDKTITRIEKIDDGKREDIPKWNQATYKKIK